MFEVERKNISKWKAKRDAVDCKLKRSSFKVASQTLRSSYPEMETVLHEWILSQRRKEAACISGIMIKRQAQIIFEQVYKDKSQSTQDFAASEGWKSNFLKRKNLVLRRVTTAGRDLPSDTIVTIRKFLNDCQTLRNMPDYDRKKVLICDETAIYLDAPSNYTYEEKGHRRVKATTCGAERTRVSAMFTASAAGTKLPIYIILPRKELNFTLPDNVVVMYKTGGTVNDDVICDYLNRIVHSYISTADISDPVLFLDSSKCHLTSKVTTECINMNKLHIGKYIIPPRMTNLLQPADVSWFKSIKNSYRQGCSSWFMYENRTYTVHGNAKSPGYEWCINKLSEIWRNFSVDQISNSFDKCGISSSNDLHSVLKHVLQENHLINDYVDDLQENEDLNLMEEDDRDMFDPVDETISQELNRLFGQAQFFDYDLPSSETNSPNKTTEINHTIPQTQSTPNDEEIHPISILQQGGFI